MAFQEASISTEALFVAAAIVLLSTLFQLWRFFTRKRSRLSSFPFSLPPGNVGLPFVGETLQFLYARRRNLLWTFFDNQFGLQSRLLATKECLGCHKPLLRSDLPAQTNRTYNKDEQEMLERPFTTMALQTCCAPNFNRGLRREGTISH